MVEVRTTPDGGLVEITRPPRINVAIAVPLVLAGCGLIGLAWWLDAGGHLDGVPVSVLTDLGLALVLAACLALLEPRLLRHVADTIKLRGTCYLDDPPAPIRTTTAWSGPHLLVCEHRSPSAPEGHLWSKDTLEPIPPARRPQ